MKCDKLYLDPTNVIKHLARSDKETRKGPGARDRKRHVGYKLGDEITFYKCRKGINKEDTVTLVDF